jgi:hypothetical protein
MAGKPKAPKPKTKAEKQALAEAELKSCLEAGASSAVVMMQEQCSSPPSPTPTTASLPEEKTPQDKNQENIRKLHKRIKHLEHQITIAHEHSQWSCPGEIIASLGK